MNNNSKQNSKEYHFLSSHKLKYGINTILLILLSISAVTEAYSKLSPGKAGFLLPNTNISFIENIGQIMDQNGNPRPEVKFLLDYKGLKIHLKENSFSYERYTINSQYNNSEPFQAATINSHRVDIEITGSNKDPDIIAMKASDSYFNYFFGGKSLTGAKCYKSIRYINIYPEIDLIFYVRESDEYHRNPEIKYDFIVYPGGNVEDIELKFSGDDNLLLRANGDLIIETSQGSITEGAPLSYSINIENYKDYDPTLQKADDYYSNNDLISNKVIIESNYKLDGNRLSFECSEYDKTKELVIDPQLIWGTYFGGSGTDISAGVAVDAAGNIIIAGSTLSTNMIATSGAYKTTISNGFDTFIAKFTPAGVQSWGTYYGGNGNDWCAGITVDDNRNIIICGGTTGSNGISTPGTHQTSHGGGPTDGYIAKFTSNGGLVWGTYFGGSEFDYSVDISTGTSGNIYTVGLTGSSNSIATPGSHQTTPAGSYMAKFNSNGRLLWGSYYGGGQDDIVCGIDVNSNGNFAICGDAESATGIATPGAYKENPDGTDAFLALFNSSGTRQWGTYFGGTGADGMQSILFDNNGDIISCGSTTSSISIATPGAHQITLGGGTDGMLVKFSPSGELIWSTYYGGSGTDLGFDIEKGNEGNLLFTGVTTSSNNISTPGVHQTQINGSESTDAFVVKFTSSGSRQWGTYFGGANNEFGSGDVTNNNVIAVDGLNNIILSGATNSIDGIATPGAHQESFQGSSDCFIAKFEPYPHRLTTGNVLGPFCAGDEFNINFIVNQIFDSGNSFTAELSGPDGDFNDSRTIGSAQGRNSGTISVILPEDLVYGINYRIRINADNPTANGIDNGMDIVIYPLPQPIINGQFVVCEGAIESYTASDLIGTNSWEIDGGNPISPLDRSTITIEWGSIGKGSIILSQKVDSTECENLITIDVNIIEKPTAFFSVPDSICLGDTISVTGNPGMDEREIWTADGGKFSAGNDPMVINITWDSAGVFDIKLIVWDIITFCADTLIKKITVLERPRADILGSISVCENHTELYFAVDSNNIQSRWEVEGGTINGSNKKGHVVIDWELSGPGMVTLIQRNSQTGCSDTVSYLIEITQFPAPDFDAEPDVCEGDELTYYSNSAPGIINKWEVSGGIISGKDDSSVVVIKWENPGQAEIILTQTISGTDCINSIKKSFTVHPKPDPEILGEIDVCANIIYSYQAGQTIGVEYKWTAPGGDIIGTDNDANLEVKWTYDGQDTVMLIETITATGCTDSTFIVVNISEFEKAEITALDNEVCKFDTLSFSTSSTYEILWKVDGGSIIGDPSARQINIVWDISGEREVMLIHKHPDNDCIDTSKTTITVHPLPDPIITGNVSSCTDCMESYTSSHIDENAYWYIVGGEIIDSTDKNEISVEWTGNDEGIIKLVLINPLTGCKDSTEVIVSLDGSPGNNILGSNKVCSGSIREYRSKQTMNLTFDWRVTGGNAMGATNDASVFIEWPEQGAGKITLYLTNLVNNDKDTSNLDVEIMSTPKAIITGFDEANRNSRLQYTTASEAGVNISWSVTGGLLIGIPSANEINVDWGSAGNGIVELIKTDEINGCSDTARLEVLIIDSDANAILSVDSLNASPGEKVIVPIRLNSSKDLILARVSGFETELRFNATVLSPSGNTPVGTIRDGVRIIPLQLSSTPIRDNILAEFDFVATLGNTQNTILSLTDPKPVGGLAVVYEIDGSFRLTGLCQEGGTRLVINTNERSLGQNVPNPANESTIIIYTLIEPGFISIELYNLYGELISVIENSSKSPGTYSLKYNTASLMSGTYIYLLKTPTKILSKVMKVLH